jgi:hypothetical protein
MKLGNFCKVFIRHEGPYSTAWIAYVISRHYLQRHYILIEPLPGENNDMQILTNKCRHWNCSLKDVLKRNWIYQHWREKNRYQRCAQELDIKLVTLQTLYAVVQTLKGLSHERGWSKSAKNLRRLSL